MIGGAARRFPGRARLLHRAGGQIHLRADRPRPFWPPESLPEAGTEASALESSAAAAAAFDDRYERGGFPEAVARLLVMAIRERGAVDRRSLMIVNALNEHRTGLPPISEVQLHSLLAEQALLVQLDAERAVRALAKLLPTRADRERAVSVVARIMRLGPEMCDPKSPLARGSRTSSTSTRAGICREP